MPSQPQGLGSDGLQVVSRCVVALKANFSSISASPATPLSLLASQQGREWHCKSIREEMQLRTVRGEGHRCRGAEQGGDGDGGGAHARRLPDTVLLLPFPVHGSGGGGGFLAFLGFVFVWEVLKARLKAEVVCERRVK